MFSVLNMECCPCQNESAHGGFESCPHASFPSGHEVAIEKDVLDVGIDVEFSRLAKPSLPTASRARRSHTSFRRRLSYDPCGQESGPRPERPDILDADRGRPARSSRPTPGPARFSDRCS